MQDMVQPLVWDLFCHVVDNFGDVGVCWRLSCDLASRGQTVRLWASDSTALAWMAPSGHTGVEVRNWDDSAALDDCGDVVIEAFGCELPEHVLQVMARREPAPVWINLEYRTAEEHARRNHGLPSPQLSGPAQGLIKWFFYPGFVAGTGGLIRERDLEQRQREFDSAAWFASLGLERKSGERVLSLFCYESAPIASLIDALCGMPTLLLATPGPAIVGVRAALGPGLQRGALRAIELPKLTQLDFDLLLWACDLNFVRGEDSWVRALWAGRPFVWQPYVQHDAAHQRKLAAFLECYLETADAAFAAELRALFEAWSQPQATRLALPETGAWKAHALRRCETLARQSDLCTQLLGSVNERS